MSMFCCASCHRARDNASSGIRLVLGSRTRVCLSCRMTIDSNRGVMPKTTRRPGRFLVGSDGKMIKEPNEIQSKFTSHRKVEVQTEGNFPAYDSRYQCDPSFRGELSKLGPGRYPDDV